MFYPTGNSTNGRNLVCIEDERKNIDSCVDGCNCNESCNCVENWLDQNDYCVEKWQLKDYLKGKGFALQKLDEDMDGGSAPPATGLATLDNVGGMGNPISPTNGGTNSGFYDNSKNGSGDKFSTLTVGTGAANKKGKSKKKMISYREFVDRNRKKKKK
jgi:hypothetical protein